MKVKRLIALIIIVCFIMTTPVCAKMKTHWLRASGRYDIMAMTGKRDLGLDGLSKKQKKEVKRLYNKNPRKLYKKYRKKLWLSSVFKTKLKNNTLTIWGKLIYKGNGVKKKYKFGKYKFKLSRNAKMTYGHQGTYGPIYETSSVKTTRKYLRKPCGLSYWFYVSGGKIYKISSSS